MKFNWKYIQVLLLIVVVALLYGFSDNRNAQRIPQEVEVKFTNGQNLFITPEIVNNLLIVNREDTLNQSKERLDLNRLEKKLNENRMIEKAEVFRTIGGKLGAVVTQREPIARVFTNRSFYIDKNGEVMPLSSKYAARVPIITGIDSTAITEIFPLLKRIQNDKFLAEYVTGLTRKSNGDYKLNLRGSGLKINFGEVADIDRKIKNFKAFYNKAHNEELLGGYSEISLKYTNQVVCTKKED